MVTLTKAPRTIPAGTTVEYCDPTDYRFGTRGIATGRDGGRYTSIFTGPRRGKVAVRAKNAVREYR